MWLCTLLLCAGLSHRLIHAYPSIGNAESTTGLPYESPRDDTVSRKVLGSSVVTSVSVIMDTGSEKIYADAVGKPQLKPSSPSQVASPINLLNPDRYEFYTFNDSGDLVKRLMTLSEIQGIIANADGDAFNQNSHSPEKKVNDVVSNVQTVLKSEIEKATNYNTSNNIVLDTPDVSSSWSVILPAIFGNSGEEIKPVKPQTIITPETIILENHEENIVPVVKKPQGFKSTTSTKKPTRATVASTSGAFTLKTPVTTTTQPTTTTNKPVKATSTIKRIRTTPTTAIPRITTRGTRPYRRPTITTTTSTTTSTTVKPTTLLEPVDEAPDVLERVKHTTTSSVTPAANANVAQASSHFIHLFDPVHTIEPHKTTAGLSLFNSIASTSKKPIFISTTPRTPPVSEGALFIIDEKTNTRIPITTKEQLALLLTKLDGVSTTVGTILEENEPLITLNSVSGHQEVKIDGDSAASSTQAQVTQSELDIEKYQQLLLTSTNIYEINKEFSKSTTAPPSITKNTPISSTRKIIKSTTLRPTTLKVTTTTPTTLPTEIPTVLPTSQNITGTSNLLGSTLKEPNLVNSIEQLIQQAVGNIQEVSQSSKITKPTSATPTKPINSSSTPKITTAIRTTTNPPTTVVTSTFPTTITEEFSTVPNHPQPDKADLSISDDLLLNEAVGSLLSQVVGSDFQGLTTLEDLPSTTEILDKPEKASLEFRIKTTDIFSETTTGTAELTTEEVTLKPKTTANQFNNLGLAAEIESKTDMIQGQTTESGERFASTTNEILNSEATTYSRTGIEVVNTNEIDKATETTTFLSTITDIPTEATTELVKDLPVVFDEVLYNFKQDIIDPTTTIPTIPGVASEKNVDKESTATLNPVDAQTAGTTEKFTDSTQLAQIVVADDSDTLASTNAYKEVTSNSALPDLDTESVTSTNAISTVSKKEASTLSIEELIKELTTKTDESEVPKETTVLIITKPLYTTTNVPSSVTEGPKTTLPVYSTLEAKEVATEAISADAINSNFEIPIVNETVKEWTIVSTIAPHNVSSTSKEILANVTNSAIPESKLPQPARPVELNPMPQLSGLEETTKNLDQDIHQFVALCNELAFGFWKSVTTGISSARSVILSPFAATSLLAMVFLGARGATSGEMNEILRLDDMVTFNPHLIFKNISESLQVSKEGGVATSVILRELYSDKSKGHLLNFYKERAKAFYDGHVEEVSFKEIGDVIRRRTNLIVKKQTDGKIPEYIKDSTIIVKRPLAGVSASIFQTDCTDASMEGRDGELYFVVLPSIRQRRLVPVPAAVWRSNFLAGYDPLLDATVVALGSKQQTISTIYVIPGQQGIAAPGDGLARLERSLIGGAFKEKSWSRLLMTLIPRPGLEVQIPRFQHRSVINATVALQQMGMRDLFDAAKADLRGLNGVANDLYLSDILQVNNFATCGEEVIGESHHSEIYPATANRTYRRSRKFKDTLPPDSAYYDSELSEEPRDYQRAFHDPLHDPSLYALPLPLRPRQARLPDPPRLRYDRPFLYFVRHNPTGLILHMGRFNPRLLP